MTTAFPPTIDANVSIPYDDDMIQTTAYEEVGGQPITLVNWLVPLIFGFITVIGVLGNALVCYVILRHLQMRTATNYFIMNLAITDIAFLVCCAPFTASVFALNHWIFGQFLCKFVFYMMHVTAQATCMMLTAMSIDRYQAIMHPLRSLGTRTQSGVLIVSGCIWAFSALSAIPLAVFMKVKQLGGGPICVDDWPYREMFAGYALLTAFILYIIPLAIIVVCYTAILRNLWKTSLPGEEESSQSQNQRRIYRQRRRVTWMVLSVVVVFAICWMPLYFVNLWLRLDPNFPKTTFMYGFKIFSHILSYANSCVNPFVYAFMGRNFQRYFRTECKCCYTCYVMRKFANNGRRKVMTEDRAMAHFKSGHSAGNTHSTIALPLFSRSSRSSQS
ncbi:G-protein coupled receptor 54-like [Diadema setosum]|uniref:G-protein coupled receptor 54-like n=1 Tax=Diadema setosum TaxID=31175 RepID=UPI003B3B7365